MKADEAHKAIGVHPVVFRLVLSFAPSLTYLGTAVNVLSLWPDSARASPILDCF